MYRLSDVLNPVPLHEFVSDYWQRKSLFVKGTAGKFAGLFDRHRFFSVAGQARGIHAEWGAGQNVTGVRPEQMDGLLKSGATLCLTGIEHVDSGLQTLTLNAKRELLHAGEVSIRSYLSAEGCGFDLHFDARVATTLQIEGCKRWWFSKTPAVPFPARNCNLIRPGQLGYQRAAEVPVEVWERFAPPDETELCEVLLEPGDVLCLPAGTWHRAKAAGTSSLALNLAFDSLGFLGILTAAIAPLLVNKPEWRQCPPPALSGETSPFGVPRELIQFFTSRLDELRAALASLDPEGPDLARAWMTLVQDGVPRELTASRIARPGRDT
jgi:hypothetical protein